MIENQNMKIRKKKKKDLAKNKIISILLKFAIEIVVVAMEKHFQNYCVIVICSCLTNMDLDLFFFPNFVM